MLKAKAGPEFRPKRQLSAQIGYRILFLGIVVLVYCFIAAAGRESVHQNLQKQHSGKKQHTSLMLRSQFVLTLRANVEGSVLPITKNRFGNMHLGWMDG
jgi:hypothetical protein